MSNILVTGAHGPLGNEMQRLAEQDAENMYVFTDVAELDIDGVSHFDCRELCCYM